MAVDVVVPAVGESVQEGMVYKWHKATGDYVEMDDVLVELETDKATVEIVAEVSGVITQKTNEGDTVKVGDVLASIDTDASAAPSKEAAPVKEVPPPEPEPQVSQPQEARSSTMADQLSPAVNRLVNENKLDASAIAATGPGGRVTKGDVISHMEQGKKDLSVVTSEPAKKTEVATSVAPSGSRETWREPMSMLRRRIAERLLEAQQTNAILTTFNEVDMSAVMSVRKQYKESFKEKHGVGLGFMSFFVKAAIEGLKSFPLVNGYIDGTDIVKHNYYDIGVAISTDRGLMVPVIRDAQNLTFDGIEQSIVDYAAKARAGKIAIDDLTGGTFTITNGGVFGSLVSTPIINPPQSAILGMHKIQERVMVENGEMVVKPMMYLALSYDHRIVDGKEAVSFLVKVKDCIEDPSRLLLGV